MNLFSLPTPTFLHIYTRHNRTELCGKASTIQTNQGIRVMITQHASRITRTRRGACFLIRKLCQLCSRHIIPNRIPLFELTWWQEKKLPIDWWMNRCRWICTTWYMISAWAFVNTWKWTGAVASSWPDAFNFIPDIQD